MAETVTIACKLPHGLFLDLVDPKVFDDVDPKAGVASRPAAERVRINGAAQPVGVPLPDGAPRVIGGYGLTPGVDAAFWAAWLAQNKDYPPVKAGLIFAQSKDASASAEASEKKALKSGLEGLDPDKPAPGVKRDKAA